MNAVANVRPPAHQVIPGALAPTHGTAPSLLPPSDMLSELYVTVNQQRDAQANQAKSRTEAVEAERRNALERERDAMQRAQEAASKGGLFDWISNDIGLAGAVGLVSFNYGLVAADVAAHKMGLFDHVKEKVDLVDVAAVATGRWEIVAAEALVRKTDLAPEDARRLLERSGARTDVPGISYEDVKPVAKDLLLANLAVLAVGATVLSCGSTTGLCVALAGVALSQAGPAVAKSGTFDAIFGKGSSEYIGLGMQIGGAAAMGCAGFAGGAELVAGAKEAAGIASATTGAAKGTDRVVTAIHQREQDQANIDVAEARQRLARLQQLSELIVDGARVAMDSHQKSAETIQGIAETRNATQAIMAQGVRG